uniref:collagen alpha-1(II) chain-like n=1 Tax=Jaculus jaculus TaxID=51337 RepID=UPI001E1B2F03|nr:collagen alpha-1(II) chain-like [Jaculus jaculus]
MHHHPRNRERAINLSILSVSGPDFGFPEAARRVMGITPPHRQSASFMVGTTTDQPGRSAERAGEREGGGGGREPPPPPASASRERRTSGVPGESGDGKGRTADARAPRATRPPFPQRGRGDEAGGGRHEGGHPGRPHPPQAPHPSARETGPNTAGDPNDHRDADTPSHPPAPERRRGERRAPQRGADRRRDGGHGARGRSGPSAAIRTRGTRPPLPAGSEAERREAHRQVQRTRPQSRREAGGEHGERRSDGTRDARHPAASGPGKGDAPRSRHDRTSPGTRAGISPTSAPLAQRWSHATPGTEPAEQKPLSDATTTVRLTPPHGAEGPHHTPPRSQTATCPLQTSLPPARQTRAAPTVTKPRPRTPARPRRHSGSAARPVQSTDKGEGVRCQAGRGTTRRAGGRATQRAKGNNPGKATSTANHTAGPAGKPVGSHRPQHRGAVPPRLRRRAGPPLRGRPKTVERPNRRRDPTPHHDADTRATAANRPATRRDIAATPQRPSVESRRPGFRSGKGKASIPCGPQAGTRRPSTTRAHAHKHRQPHGTGSTGGERGGASDGRIDSAQRDPPRTHEQGDEGRGRQSQRTVPTAGTGGTPHHAPGWLVRAKPRPTHVDIQGETGGYYAQTKGGGRRGIRGPPQPRHNPGAGRPNTGAHHNSAIAAGGWRRGSGAGTTPPLSLRHLEGQPGALQEHHKGPRQRRSTHRSGGHVARHRGQPLPVRRGTANRTRGRRRNGKRDQGPAARNRGPPATVTGREVKQSRAGYRTPAFHTPPTGGEEKRGARRQNEKSGPIRHECPSLAWRGLGPARSEHHRTTSINQTSGRTTSGKGTRGDPFGSEEPKDIGRNEPGGQSHRERPRLDTDMRGSRENTTRVTREDSGRWVNRGLRFKRPQKKNLPEGKKKGKKFHHPTGALGRLQPAAATESGNQDPEEKDPR